MDNLKFEIEGDLLIKYTPVLQAGKQENVFQSEVVLDKATFIKCFNQWIVAEAAK